MQREIFVQHELTGQIINPTMNKETSIFMSDGEINTEGGQGYVAPKAPVQRGAVVAPADQLMSRWQSALSPRELQNPDTRRTVDAAVELGFGPAKVTSKGRTEQKAQQVVENSLLDSQDPEVVARSRDLAGWKDILSDDLKDERDELFRLNAIRLAKAEEILKDSLEGRTELSDAEKVAILKAHFVGMGERGKDGKEGSAGVYNVAPEQLAEKVKILKEAGFDKEQRREIIESGITQINMPPNPFTNQFISDKWNMFYNIARAGGGGDVASRIINEVVLHMEANPNDLTIQNEGLNFIALSYGSGENPQKKFTNAYDSDANVLQLKSDIRTKELEIFNLQRIDEEDRTAQERELYQQRLAEFRTLDRQLYNQDVLVDGSSTSLREIVERLSFGGQEQLSPQLIDAISDSDKALEYLIARIIDPPMDSETSAYEIDFYAGINLALIRSVLQRKSLHEGDVYIQDKGKVQYESFNLEKEAARIFHEVHRALTAGNFEGAGSALRPEHFEFLQRKLGNGNIQRLIEGKYFVANARDGFVSGRINDRIMGSESDVLTGRPLAHQPRSILASLEKQKTRANDLAQYLRGNGIAGVDMLEELGEMDPWEVTRARNLGRILYSVSERPSEIIALGTLPDDEESNLSVPREDSVRIIDQLKWIYKRWKVSDNHGGGVVQSIRRKFFEDMKREDGYKELNIDRMLAGQEIHWIESVGDVGVTGLYSTWRELEIILTRIDVPHRQIQTFEKVDETLRPMTVDLTNLYDIFINLPKVDAHHKAEFLEQVFLETNQQGQESLRPEFRSGLGILARRLLPTEKDAGHERRLSFGKLRPRDTSLWDAKEKIRTKLWERAAEDNPIILASFLQGLRYKKGVNLPAEIDEETRIVDIFGPQGKAATLGVSWEQFEDKMLWFNEVRVQFNKSGQNLDLPSVIAIATSTLSNENLALSPEEGELYDYIVAQGRGAAKELANVKFSIEPFMTDVSFETLDIKKAGPTFIKRRLAGDLGATIQSHKAMGELLDNPAGTDPDHMIEVVGGSVKALSGPYGKEGAQKRLLPLFMAMASMYEKGGHISEFWNNLAMRQLRKSPVGDIFLTLARRPKSIAQQFGGLEAAALDEQDMYVLGEKALKEAVMDHHFFKKYKKKFAGSGRMLWFLFRDVLSLAIVTTVLSTSKKGFTEGDTFK